jgi:hypothetical protein
MSKRKSESESDSDVEVINPIAKKVKVEEAVFPPTNATHLFLSAHEDGADTAYSFNANSTKDADSILSIIKQLIKTNDSDDLDLYDVFVFIHSKSAKTLGKYIEYPYNPKDYEEPSKFIDELEKLDVGEWNYVHDFYKLDNIDGKYKVSTYQGWA